MLYRMILSHIVLIGWQHSYLASQRQNKKGIAQNLESGYFLRVRLDLALLGIYNGGMYTMLYSAQNLLSTGGTLSLCEIRRSQ